MVAGRRRVVEAYLANADLATVIAGRVPKWNVSYRADRVVPEPSLLGDEGASLAHRPERPQRVAALGAQA